MGALRVVLQLSGADGKREVIFAARDRARIEGAVGAVGVVGVVEVERVETLGVRVADLEVTADVVRFLPGRRVGEPDGEPVPFARRAIGVQAVERKSTR